MDPSLTLRGFYRLLAFLILAKLLLCPVVSFVDGRVLQHPYSRAVLLSFLRKGWFLVRTALVTTFHETVNFCFTSVLETMGTSVRDVVFERLSHRGIPSSDVSSRFDDAVEILNESFGGSARIIVYRTLVELYQQYGMRVDFTYQDSLKDRMVLLRERVVNDHLVPKRAMRDDSVLSFYAPLVQSPGPASRPR